MAVRVSNAIGAVEISRRDVHPGGVDWTANKPTVIDAGRILVQRHPSLRRFENSRNSAEITPRCWARSISRPRVNGIHSAIHGHAADGGNSTAAVGS